MIQVGTFEAKTRLSELLQKVSAGETVIITRHGHPVARLCPVAKSDLTSRAEVIRRIRENRRQWTLGRISVRELIEEGRR